MSFMSDTTAPAHPALVEAIERANHGLAASYGADEISAGVQRAIAEVFETDVAIRLVGSGTAANALALSVLCSGLGAVACHEEAHIARDERGAVSFFTGGAQLALLPGAHGKIERQALDAAIRASNPGFVHETPLEALSLTNLTESGAAYSAAEIAERAGLAKAAGLGVHLDGARFANALVATGASPAELTWKAGVDVVCFGATKNGAMGCEAIVLLGEAAARLPLLEAHAKRAGHMPAKARFLAAQMQAYLEDGLWLDLARAANAKAAALAETLAAFPGAEITQPVDGNEVFVRLPERAAEALRAAGASFSRWLDGSYRLVCSWRTTDAEIAAVAAALDKLAARAPARSEGRRRRRS